MILILMAIIYAYCDSQNVNDCVTYKLEKEKDDDMTKEKYLHNDIEWCGSTTIMFVNDDATLFRSNRS